MNLETALIIAKSLTFLFALYQTVVAGCSIIKIFAQIQLHQRTNGEFSFVWPIALWTIFYTLTCFTPDYIATLNAASK